MITKTGIATIATAAAPISNSNNQSFQRPDLPVFPISFDIVSMAKSDHSHDCKHSLFERAVIHVAFRNAKSSRSCMRATSACSFGQIQEGVLLKRGNKLDFPCWRIYG